MHEQAPYIVMELLEGVDLARRVEVGGPLEIAAAVDCILEACVAVAEAHARGIIHRDLKPGNLFSTRTGTRELVKVLDFGISKVTEPEPQDGTQTREDTMLGTPLYTSPEQLRNPARVDGRTDVWSLGVSLFFLLTGEHPFEGATAGELTAAVFADPPRDPRSVRPDLPEALCDTLRATLAKRPEQRIASVIDLVEQLVPFGSERGRRAAESVAAMGAAVEPLDPFEPSRDPSFPTTEDGLASTLRTAPGADVPRDRPSARFGAAWIIAALALGGSIAAALMWSLRPEPIPLRPLVVLPAPVLSPSQAPRQAPVASAASPAVSAEPTSVAAAPRTQRLLSGPPQRAPRLDARPDATSPAPGPSSAPSAPAPDASVQRDRDGVPIVE
jgi:serine/threonine-protein kinase